LRWTDDTIRSRSQPFLELEQAGTDTAKQAWLVPSPDQLDYCRILGKSPYDQQGGICP
jgi:hypothetical protein